MAEVKESPGTNNKRHSPPKSVKREENRDKSVPPRSGSKMSERWVKVPVEYSQFSDYITNMLSKSNFKESFLSHVDFSKFEEITVFKFPET